MENEIETTLEGLGLSKNEAIIYVALLRLGEASATEIAQQSKLHRPNVYDSLNSLIEKGLASYISVENSKRFRALPPNNLAILLKQKEIDLLKVIPALELEAKLSRAKQSFADVQHGLKAFRALNFHLLDYYKPMYVFGVPANVPKIMASFVDHFHKERIKRKIMFRHIYNEDARERIRYLNSLPYTEAAYLPDHFNSPVSTFICGPEVAIIKWEPLMFIRIVDENLARAYEHYFEKLYEASKRQ